MARGWTQPCMRLISYPVSYLYDVLPDYGFEDIEISVFGVRSNGDPHPFVLGRKISS